MVDLNELRRRAGLVEAEPEIFGPDSGVGDDAVDAEEARLDAIRDLEREQRGQIIRSLMGLGFSKYEFEDNTIRVSVDFQDNEIEYLIEFGYTSPELSVGVIQKGIELGLWTAESTIRGGSRGTVHIETRVPAQGTIFAQFVH